MPTSHTGRLFDLAPDGLGFIALEHPPKVFAFHLRHLGHRNFDQAGLAEGMLVSFHLNPRRQVDRITPSPTPDSGR